MMKYIDIFQKADGKQREEVRERHCKEVGISIRHSVAVKVR